MFPTFSFYCKIVDDQLNREDRENTSATYTTKQKYQGEKFREFNRKFLYFRKF